MTGNLQNQQKFTKVSRNDAEIIGFERCFSGYLRKLCELENSHWYPVTGCQAEERIGKLGPCLANFRYAPANTKT